MSAPHHRPDGGFRNPWLPGGGGDLPGRFGAFLKWVLVDRLTKPLPADPDPAVFRRAVPAFARPRAGPDELLVTWVGHATFLLQVGGLNLRETPRCRDAERVWRGEGTGKAVGDRMRKGTN